MRKSFLQKAGTVSAFFVVLATYIYAAVIIESPFFKAGIVITALFVLSRLIEHADLKDEIVRLHQRIAAFSKENSELKKRLKAYEDIDDSNIPQYFDDMF